MIIQSAIGILPSYCMNWITEPPMEDHFGLLLLQN